VGIGSIARSFAADRGSVFVPARDYARHAIGSTIGLGLWWWVRITSEICRVVALGDRAIRISVGASDGPTQKNEIVSLVVIDFAPGDRSPPQRWPMILKPVAPQD